MPVADCSYRRLLTGHIKASLQTCVHPLTPNLLSISHRGAPLVFPEHTREVSSLPHVDGPNSAGLCGSDMGALLRSSFVLSVNLAISLIGEADQSRLWVDQMLHLAISPLLQGYQEALRLGAKWIECDAAVTQDFELVCRHSQCDLHATTNILSVPALSAKCSVPHKVCCTYDITLAEYSTLCGVADDASGPHLQLHSWDPARPSECNAHPAALAEMAEMVLASGGSLIPEQKTCDLMCQVRIRPPRSFFLSAAAERL